MAPNDFSGGKPILLLFLANFNFRAVALIVWLLQVFEIFQNTLFFFKLFFSNFFFQLFFSKNLFSKNFFQKIFFQIFFQKFFFSKIFFFFKNFFQTFFFKFFFSKILFSKNFQKKNYYIIYCYKTCGLEGGETCTLAVTISNDLKCHTPCICHRNSLIQCFLILFH